MFNLSSTFKLVFGGKMQIYVTKPFPIKFVKYNGFNLTKVKSNGL